MIEKDKLPTCTDERELRYSENRKGQIRYEGTYRVPLFRWRCGYDGTKKWWHQRVVPGRRETFGWKGARNNFLLRLRTVCD